jgi:hypothetical protein
MSDAQYPIRIHEIVKHFVLVLGFFVKYVGKAEKEYGDNDISSWNYKAEPS